MASLEHVTQLVSLWLLGFRDEWNPITSSPHWDLDRRPRLSTTDKPVVEKVPRRTAPSPNRLEPLQPIRDEFETRVDEQVAYPDSDGPQLPRGEEIDRSFDRSPIKPKLQKPERTKRGTFHTIH